MSEGRPTDGGQTSRRTLIKGAVVAGIGAWTAPVIIESVTSPAAALSPSGCSQVFQTVGSQGLFTPGAWGGWSDGSGSATDDGLPCPPGGCAPVNATSSSFRATIPVPTPGELRGPGLVE